MFIVNRIIRVGLKYLNSLDCVQRKMSLGSLKNVINKIFYINVQTGFRIKYHTMVDMS